jgi:glycine dehydrogenase subunit 1
LLGFDSYLGAGAYSHHTPALVHTFFSKAEFLTSYTPYQAEASQGMLQIMFEFQSAICALTGLEASNDSLYDGGSACAEALLMAVRHLNRKKVILSESVHPHYREIIKLYLEGHHIEIEVLPFRQDGQLDMETFKSKINEECAAVLLQYPNFFGIIDNVKECANIAHSAGALCIVCANPMVYGLYASAKEIGADIAVGDTQPFGLPLNFGGPYAGYLACRQELIRQMPGHIVGETVDSQGRRGFVPIYQAREQHIRRGKATSNICSNSNLTAFASLMAMLWYGKQGIPQLALTNYQRACYLKQSLEALPIAESFSQAPIFNEFVVTFKQDPEIVMQKFKEHNILPGLALGRFFPQLKHSFLVAVTEIKSKEQLDRYVDVATSL